MDYYIEIFDLLIVITGIYMISWGIAGKGSVYKTENVKAGCEEKYKKLIKWSCIAGGFFAIAMGALEHFNIKALATVSFYLLCTVVVIDFIIILPLIDKNKLKNRR